MKIDETRYRPGLGRDYPHPKISHLFELGENIMEFLRPMCQRGYNRDNGQSFSIWRGNVGSKGNCKICERRAKKGLQGVSPKETP